MNPFKNQTRVIKDSINKNRTINLLTHVYSICDNNEYFKIIHS
jgi:hypothetical protein